MGHRLRSAVEAAAPSVLGIHHEFLTERYAIIRHGGDGAATTLVCGAVRFDHPAARALVELLPPTIHVGSTDSPHTEWMRSALRMMAAEAAELRPGARRC
jgi:hypothetical protein